MLELEDEGKGEQLKFRLVERGAGVRRKVCVKDVEMQWVCLILEDASSGYEKGFSRSYGGFVRRIQVNRVPFLGSFYLRLEVRDGGRIWSVCLPELSGSGGWVDISRKFWEFCGWKRLGGQIDGRSFVDVANIGDWPTNTVEVVEKARKRRGCDVEVRAKSTQHTTRFLGRCLVGRLEEGVAVLPSAMEVQRWAQRSWKVTAGVQVSDLGGVDFLFTLPSVEEAQRGEAPSVVWVRILGLPRHLWDSEVFREIGDFCGGFVRVDDNTRRRDNLRWARIAIRVAPEMIPAKVKVAMGGWVFDLPLWVEKGPLVVFQPALIVEKGGDEVVTSGSSGRELVVHSLEKTRGGVSWRARGGWGNGSSGDRGFSKFESRFSGGPGRGVGRHENNSNWVRPKPTHQEYNRSGSDVKWGYLFKRPVRSKLVEIKNKRWVSVGDPGGVQASDGLRQQSSPSVEGVGVGTSRAIGGCSVDSGEGELSSRGMELVPFSGPTVGGFSVWDNQRDELFNNLGWVEEVIEDGQLMCNDLCEHNKDVISQEIKSTIKM
ncbi:hypothetical protein RHGRI_007290 [Rhododendron griersonianum]|uniref:DUF4283 domain-containing protein n=1 Tax=Rhododendron griersonianum TaxID=479676 RepID=A0AAV6KWI8_9ERIC|nr:hypothetical protein RHGRI_007290 [Rhododendron griersonianum]